MRTFRYGLLALFCAVVLPAPANGSDRIIDGEVPCRAIGGTWEGGSACHVDRLVVPADVRLVTAPTVSLSVVWLINDGVIETNGHFAPGRFTNRGRLITSGVTVNSDLLVNQGSWLNHGWLHPHATVVNEWNFENDGYFET